LRQGTTSELLKILPTKVLHQGTTSETQALAKYIGVLTWYQGHFVEVFVCTLRHTVAEDLAQQTTLRQGTTSVVPNTSQN
jgi:hypothetical protein